MNFNDRRRALISQNFRELPDIYKQVTYISAASNNGAYIDLGIGFDTSATSEIGYIYQGSGTDLQIFGATQDSGTKRYLLSAEYGDEGRTVYFSNSNISFVSGSYDPFHIVGQEAKLKWIVKAGENLKTINLITGIETQSTVIIGTYQITRNLYLLGQNYNTGYRGNGLKQVTYFKHWDKDDNLVRDMIPCYRKSDGEIGMYDFCTQTFFTNAGYGMFTAPVPSRLPDAYQRVYGISTASNNGAYIDLGIKYEHGCKYEISMQYDTTAKQIFGAAENNGKLRCMMTSQFSTAEHYYFTNNNVFTSGYYSMNGVTTGNYFTVLVTMKAGEYPTAQNLNVGVVTTAAKICDDYVMTRNLFLLGQNYNTGYRGSGDKTVYSFKYWNNDDVLIRDMEPCYRKTDGEIGMYDFCTQTFFTNAGTGTFTKGVDII